MRQRYILNIIHPYRVFTSHLATLALNVKQRVPSSNDITEDDSDWVFVQNTTLAISERLLTGSDSGVLGSVSEVVPHVAEPLYMVALSNAKNSKERVLCWDSTRQSSSQKIDNVRYADDNSERRRYVLVVICLILGECGSWKVFMNFWSKNISCGALHLAF